MSLGRGKTPHAVEPSCRDRHSERSEESRCMKLVTAMMINTCQQEGGRGKPAGSIGEGDFSTPFHSLRETISSFLRCPPLEMTGRRCGDGVIGAGERRQTPGTMEPYCGSRHSERSEESRCMELVTAMIVNTCRQEGGRGKPAGSIGEGDFSTPFHSLHETISSFWRCPPLEMTGLRCCIGVIGAGKDATHCGAFLPGPSF